MYWSEEHYYETLREEMKREKILISCDEDKCKGHFTLIRQREYLSPRVHDNCSECGRFMSVKLHSVEDSRIISQEWI